MKRKLLSILALLCLTASSAWADWNGGTYTATVDEVRQVVYVNDDATLTINPGVTVTVTDGIHIVDGKTLTITGGGMLLVTGASGVDGNEGGDAISGNVIINGVTVSAIGGQGGDGIDGSPGELGMDSYSGGTADSGGTGEEGGQGGKGGAAFTGQVIMISGTIIAYGGNGGNGGNGGAGGNGGTGYDQYETVDDYEGEEIVGQHEELIATGCGGDGGQGGQGGFGGDGGYAFAGTLIFYGGAVSAYGGEGGFAGAGGDAGTGGAGEGGGPGSDGSPGGYGTQGFPENAFSQNVTFNAASYTMTNGNDEINGDGTGWHVVYITADNADFIADSGNCGTSGHESEVTWSLNILGQLTITGTGAMANYSAPFNMSPFNDYDLHASVKSVSIGEGVTHVGNDAFCMNLPNLTSFNIAASVTSLGGSAICSLGSLTTVTFAAGSQLKSIGQTTFNNCDALTSITLPASVTDIEEYVLYGCDNLTSVTLNSNPRIYNDHVFGSATVTMNLKANEGATGEYWTTFYNENYNFQAADGTQIFKAALSGTSLELTELTTDQIVTKNNAVILKSTTGPIALTLTATASSNDFSGNSLQGVNDAAGLTASDPSTTYVLNKTAANGVGFYKLKAGKTVGVGKAYLTYADPSNAREFISFVEPTETTDIKAIDNGQLIIDNPVFDLQGRQVSQPTNARHISTLGLKKGLYIVNGKKVIIK